MSEELRAFVDEAPLERRSIAEFVARTAASLPDGARVLDVGAGMAPYREFFSHTRYSTTDWSRSEHAGRTELDVVASADDLPFPDGSFDAILCTQVLEHVAEPGKVLDEFHRVLRDDGCVYATIPHVWEEHEAPYDYYRYTRSSITFLFERAGFDELQIRARTDAFTTLAQLTASARWSVGETAEDGRQAERQAIFDRLIEISEEFAELKDYDGRWVFPLGYTVAARRPRREGDSLALAAERGRPDPTAKEVGQRGVLYIAPWVDLGGSDKGTIDLFKHLDRERWRTSLITTQPSPNRWVGAVAPWADEVWNLPDLMSGAESATFIIDFIVSRRIEVVHIMNSRLAFDLLPDIAALPNAPKVIVQLHAEEPDRSGYVRYTATRYGNIVDAFSVTSQQLADAMLDYDVPRSKLRVITTGVDGIEEFHPDLVEPFADLPGKGPRILWPGRLVEQKDPMLTLDVLRALVDRGVEFMMDVVGDGLMTEDVKARAAQLGIADRIVWHPPSHDMPRWYRTADVLLMTSVFEGVPYVMYEALAMGVPVVVPAIPGNVEFLGVPDSGGVLIEPRDDVRAYADALEKLLRDADARTDLGHRARARMLRDCTLEAMGAAHDELYAELLEGQKPLVCTEPITPEHFILPRDPRPERTVGVIVPCYRHGRFIEEAIASIHAQSLPASQIVVVDDASPDDETRDALARIERDPRVRVIRLARNSGPSVARNRALAEIDSSYVLPLDADDVLLPGALMEMVTQLEQAPENIGFIYPNALHFGNRHDYFVAPSYNLFQLMQGNYCPATTLFDRRVFAKVRYAESWTHGHEDWDLVLQLAARGIHGQPATVPTFLYRKHGFSRLTNVEYGGGIDRTEIEARHPELYEHVELIKAEWSPALSIVLVDTPEHQWTSAALARLADQRCIDVEWLALGDVAVPEPYSGWASVGFGRNEGGLRDAVLSARGRVVALLDARTAPALERVTFVEEVLRIFHGNHLLDHVVLADVASKRPPMVQLDEHEAETAEIVGVAWRRSDGIVLPPLNVTGLASAFDDIAYGWEQLGPVQWRRMC